VAAWHSVAIALAIGLLIGSVRRGDATTQRGAGGRDETRAYDPAALRMFALAALAGVAAGLIGPVVVAAAVLAAAAFCAAAAVAGGWRPVSTSEPDARPEYHPTQRLDPLSALALGLTVLVGGLAVPYPALAVAAGVVVTLVRLARSDLPRLIRDRLAELELGRALRFLVVAFLVLPLAASRPVGPLGAVEPRRVWTFVVAVTALGWLGYVLVRLTRPWLQRDDRPDWDLPLAGLAGGFVSGAATVGAMARASREPERFRPAMAGALFATVSTLVLSVLITAVADTRVAGLLVPAAALGSLVLIAEALWLTLARPRAGSPAQGVASAGEGDARQRPTMAMDAQSRPSVPTDQPDPGVDGWVVPTERAAVRVGSATIIDGGATVTAIDFGAATPEPTPVRSAAADPAEAGTTRASAKAIVGRHPADLVPALLLAVMLVVFLILAALAERGLGAGGAVLTLTLAGLADSHAGALTAAELAHQGRLIPETATLTVAAVLAAGAVVRLVVAQVAGGRRASATLAALYAGPVVAVTVGLILALGLS
jgi:uncharacterized membrane protein (DUF4010 family)